MAGSYVSIAYLFPIGGAAALSFGGGKDQLTELAGIAGMGQGLAVEVGGDDANVQCLGADTLDGLHTRYRQRFARGRG